MKLKVNLQARGQELTAHVKLAGGEQSRCTDGRCRRQGIRYTVTVESVLNAGVEETNATVLREAKRFLKGTLGSRMALCTQHFTEYLARVTDNEEMPAEITET